MSEDTVPPPQPLPLPAVPQSGLLSDSEPEDGGESASNAATASPRRSVRERTKALPASRQPRPSKAQELDDASAAAVDDPADEPVTEADAAPPAPPAAKRVKKPSAIMAALAADAADTTGTASTTAAAAAAVKKRTPKPKPTTPGPDSPADAPTPASKKRKVPPADAADAPAADGTSTLLLPAPASQPLPPQAAKKRATKVAPSADDAAPGPSAPSAAPSAALSTAPAPVAAKKRIQVTPAAPVAKRPADPAPSDGGKAPKQATSGPAAAARASITAAAALAAELRLTVPLDSADWANNEFSYIDLVRDHCVAHGVVLDSALPAAAASRSHLDLSALAQKWTAPGAAAAYVGSTSRKNQKRSKLQLPLEVDENFYDDTDGFIDDTNVAAKKERVVKFGGFFVNAGTVEVSEHEDDDDDDDDDDEDDVEEDLGSGDDSNNSNAEYDDDDDAAHDDEDDHANNRSHGGGDEDGGSEDNDEEAAEEDNGTPEPKAAAKGSKAGGPRAVAGASSAFAVDTESDLFTTSLPAAVPRPKKVTLPAAVGVLPAAGVKPPRQPRRPSLGPDGSPIPKAPRKPRTNPSVAVLGSPASSQQPQPSQQLQSAAGGEMMLAPSGSGSAAPAAPKPPVVLVDLPPTVEGDIVHLIDAFQRVVGDNREKTRFVPTSLDPTLLELHHTIATLTTEQKLTVYHKLSQGMMFAPETWRRRMVKLGLEERLPDLEAALADAKGRAIAAIQASVAEQQPRRARAETEHVSRVAAAVASAAGVGVTPGSLPPLHYDVEWSPALVAALRAAAAAFTAWAQQILAIEKNNLKAPKDRIVPQDALAGFLSTDLLLHWPASWGVTVADLLRWVAPAVAPAGPSHAHPPAAAAAAAHAHAAPAPAASEFPALSELLPYSFF